MVRKGKTPGRRDLLESTLSELAPVIKDISPRARVEISFERCEDEDVHVCVHPAAVMQTEEIERLDLAIGERCNDVLLEKGLFILSTVCK
jgi:hypothetical protein